MTDAERREKIAQEDNIRQVIWRIAGLHTLTEIQATLLARLILRREETWQREIVKPLEHGLDLRAEVIANHVAENKRLLKVVEAANTIRTRGILCKGMKGPRPTQAVMVEVVDFNALKTALADLKKGRTP